MDSVLLSHKSDHWSTPKAFYDALNAEFGPFDFDPCTLNQKGEFGWKDLPWNGKIFLNPPYSEVGDWIKKAWHETKFMSRAELVVCLIPARTDTKWFHGFCYGFEGAPEIRFIKGRLKFGDAKNSAPFPSMLVIFRRNA